MKNNGILIYAHNNEKIDYIKLAILSAKFSKKYLDLPITLVSDDNSLEYAKKNNLDKKFFSLFDNILTIEKPKLINKRNYKNLDKDNYLDFLNSSRFLSWDLTPYDRTLIIDSDFLIMSHNLKNYFDFKSDFMIGKEIDDIVGNTRLGFNDKYVSFIGIKMYWATTIMFTKNEKTKQLFDLVKHIQQNYNTYSQIYRFDTRTFRNDIAFSIALHILDGYITVNDHNLPPVLSFSSKDLLVDAKNNNLFFVCDAYSSNQTAVSISDVDVHIMNKINLLENFEKLMDLQ